MHGCMDKIYRKLYFFAFYLLIFFPRHPPKMSLLLVNVPVMPRWYAYTFIPFFVYYSLYKLSVTSIALNLWREQMVFI